MGNQEKIIAKLKEYDDYLDSISTTPEKAEWGKQVIRQQIDKMPLDSLKLMALDMGLKMIKGAKP
jgi:hypothetical protein